MGYLKNVLSRKAVPQNQPIPGSNQVPNSAGGYAFPVDDWARLDRFLILGSEGGSYYASERVLTLENAQAVSRCIQADGPRVVARVVEISDAGRAPKNDPAIFALALCAGAQEVATRRAALAALPRVCRIGTHLFHFAEYVEGFRGWGRGLRAAVGDWYNAMEADKLAYQAVKYQSRDRWSHRDLLRLAHPKPASDAHRAVYRWITQGWDEANAPSENGLQAPAFQPDEDAPRLIRAFEQAKRAQSAAEIVALIRDHGLPREAVPTEWLTEAAVWEALLAQMPMTALIRNLATMTRVGLLTPRSEAARKVVEQVTDRKRLKTARIHPIAVLSALKTYAQGQGVRGQNTWKPVPAVTDALDRAFYLAFENVEPTGKRWMLALDVSGSMTCGMIAGVPGLTPRVASAAMAMVTAAREPDHRFTAFCDKMVPYDVKAGMRLDEVVRRMDGMPFGGTDCALPMLWAKDKKVPVDVFAVLTSTLR